uniref:C2H2-type domain-containing protein n=1 Tax=viral metagenome TaxID=1070528 RepID=A0A6C0HT96_9ZZZZ
MDTKISQNTTVNYNCLICKYTTLRKNDYNKHILTAKHIRDTNKIQNPINVANNIFICICGKEYKYSQGLSKHKKNCDYKPVEEPTPRPQEEINETNINYLINTEIIIDIIKENKEFKKLIVEQNNKLIEQTIKVSQQNNQVIELHKENNILNKENNILNKENNILINKLVEKESIMTINNNNNTTNNNQKFNLNFFLNETCKDAMNMKEFIDNIKVTFEELLAIGNTGFVNGVSDIFIKRLKDMDITKRPIHCTDLKRETIYLKEDNEWNKDENENENLKNAIEKVEYKNFSSLNEWCEENPETRISSSDKGELYMKIFEKTLEGDDKTREKIVKNITKKITIDK